LIPFSGWKWRETRNPPWPNFCILLLFQELDFDEFTPHLLAFLESYRTAEKTKRESKAKIAAAKAAAEDSDGDDKDVDETDTPHAKRRKVDPDSPSKADEDEDADDDVEDVHSTAATSVGGED
jgi:hypothetical protein